MGLDCSHNAFSGAYSAFNRFRQCVAHAAGGSYPPHFIYKENGEPEEGERANLDPRAFYVGQGQSEETHPGLFEFLRHSDCDGEISPEMCSKVADDLEAILAKVAKMKWRAGGHISRDGGYAEVLMKFIEGCRQAALRNEPLEFY